MVWDKASQDSTGLREFFSTHRQNYMWPERAEVTTITVEGANAGTVMGKVRKLLARQSIETIAAKFNKKQPTVSFQRKRYTQDELTKEGLEWKEGYTTAVQEDKETGKQSFRTVSSLLPPQPKELDESRGYVIADYQDYLEKVWVENLRQKYPVHVNESVLNGLSRD
jgi:peptidyl-prolyl cis-trans isomerase SurA